MRRLNAGSGITKRQSEDPDEFTGPWPELTPAERAALRVEASYGVSDVYSPEHKNLRVAISTKPLWNFHISRHSPREQNKSGYHLR